MMIKLLLLLISACSAANNNCKGVLFKQQYYDIEIIKEGVHRLHEIVVNRNENTAYFTFEELTETPTRVLGYIKLDSKESGVVPGVRNATGLAMDQARNRLYIGGSDGLFMIDINKKEKVPEKLPVDADIRNIFVKDGIVYFTNGRKEAFKFEYGPIAPVYETQGIAVDKLILDDDDNILFLQNNRLFRVKIGTRIVNSHEKYVVSDIAADPNFKPFACAKDGIYEYNKYKYVLDKVSKLKDIDKLTFVTVKEPLYVVKDKIIRLNFSLLPCV